jgi:NAD(P)-dependent dehydrogenase (short-subunit alcohol dehydrogenase family)
MAGRLTNRVAVVTGGTTGIGLAVAQRFATEGAFVFITGRRQAELDAAIASIGHGAVGVRADMSVLGDIDRLYDAVQQEHSQIDVVMANAGGGDFAPLGSITEEQYEKTFGTNVKGTIFSVQKALPLLKDGGSVILTGSTTSIKGTGRFQHLQRQQSGGAEPGEKLDPRPQGSPYQSERNQPGPDRDAWSVGLGSRRRAGKAASGWPLGIGSPWPARATGRDCEYGAVPGL